MVDDVGLRIFGGWDLSSDLLEVLFTGFKFLVFPHYRRHSAEIFTKFVKKIKGPKFLPSF